MPEVTRALRALSSAYVERRHRIASGAALDTAGKRAAFALFYGPLHFLTTRHVVTTLGAATPSAIVDLGCGTGAAGAAWAIAGNANVTVCGIDRHPWAVQEARWTYKTFGLRGTARVGDLGRFPAVPEGSAVLAAYLLNELPVERRIDVEDRLIRAGRAGRQVLVLEPLSRRVAPWWDAMAARVIDAGGRADEWRFAGHLPPRLEELDRAAGLDHRELTVRSLSMNLGV